MNLEAHLRSRRVMAPREARRLRHRSGQRPHRHGAQQLLELRLGDGAGPQQARPGRIEGHHRRFDSDRAAAAEAVSA